MAFHITQAEFHRRIARPKIACILDLFVGGILTRFVGQLKKELVIRRGEPLYKYYMVTCATGIKVQSMIEFTWGNIEDLGWCKGSATMVKLQPRLST